MSNGEIFNRQILVFTHKEFPRLLKLKFVNRTEGDFNLHLSYFYRHCKVVIKSLCFLETNKKFMIVVLKGSR